MDTSDKGRLGSHQEYCETKDYSAERTSLCVGLAKRHKGRSTKAISLWSSSQGKMQCVGVLEREENVLPGPSLGGLLNVKTPCQLVMWSKPILSSPMLQKGELELCTIFLRQKCAGQGRTGSPAARWGTRGGLCMVISHQGRGSKHQLTQRALWRCSFILLHWEMQPSGLCLTASRGRPDIVLKSLADLGKSPPLSTSVSLTNTFSHLFVGPFGNYKWTTSHMLELLNGGC